MQEIINWENRNLKKGTFEEKLWIVKQNLQTALQLGLYIRQQRGSDECNTNNIFEFHYCENEVRKKEDET